MAVEVAVAYMPVVPSFDGLQRELEKGIGAPLERQSRESGKRSGEEISAGILSGLGGLSRSVGGFVSGVGGSIVSGMGISSAISREVGRVGEISRGFGTSVSGGMRTARDEVARTASSYEGMGRAFSGVWSASRATSEAAQGSMRAFKSGIDGTRTETGRLGQAVNNAGIMVGNLNTHVQNFNKQAAPSLADIRTGFDNIGRSVGDFGFQASVALGGVTALVGGMAISGGIDRAMNIENAQAKLKGLGHSTEETDLIMQNALASVKGTAYGLGDAATVAAGAVAAGIEPGNQLQQVLTTVSNSAAIAGVDMGQMGTIFNQVAATGKLQGDELLQLSDAGVPALQFLAKEMGVTTAEARDMVSKGQVDFQTFANAMQHGVGNAAFEMGKTTSGSFANMKTAISRLGAEAITPFTPLARDMFNTVTAGADSLTANVKPVFEAAAGWITRFGVAIQQTFGSDMPTQDIVTKMGIGPSSPLWGALNNGIGGVRAFGAAWRAADGDITSSGFPGFMEQVAFGARSVYDWFTNLSGPAIGGLIAVVAPLAVNFMDLGGSVGGAARALENASGPVMSIVRTLTPLGGILSGIGGALKIIGGPWGTFISLLVSSYTTSESVRSAFAGLWGAITNLASTIWDALAPAFSMLSGQGDAMSDLFSGMVQRVSDLLTVVVPVASTIINQFAPAIGSFLAGAVRGAMGVIGGLVLAISKVTAALWPVINAVLQSLAPAITFISGIISQVVQVLSGPLGTVMGIVAGSIVVVTAGIWAWTAATTALSAVSGVLAGIWAVITSPIGLIVAAVAAVAAAFYLAYTRIGWFKDGVNAIWNGIVTGTQWVGQAVGVAVNVIGGWFSWLNINAVQPAWNWIKNTIQGFANWFTITAVPAILEAVRAIGNVFSWLYQNIVQPVWHAILVVVTTVAASLLTVFQLIVGAVSFVLAPVFRWLYDGVIMPVWSWIRNTIQGFATWFSVVFIPGIRVALNVLGAVFRWLHDAVIVPVWNWIRGVINGFAIWFSTIFIPGVRAAINVMSAVFHWLLDSVIRPVWNGIKFSIQVAWDGIRAVFNAIKSFIDNVLAPVFRWFYNGVIRPVWDGIRSFIDRTWGIIRGIFNGLISFVRDVLAPVFTWFRDKVIHPVWDDIRGKIDGTVSFIRDNILRPLGDWIQHTFVDSWRKTKDGIGQTWQELKDKVKEPVKAVVEQVINRFINNYNTLNDVWSGENLAPFDTKGWSSGGWTGHGRKYDVAGVVHADEYVIQKESRNAFENKYPGYLDAINRTGDLPSTPQSTREGSSEGLYAGTVPPHGPGSISWGQMQVDASKAGRMVFSDTTLLGASVREAVKAWQGRSALDIRVGGSGPGVNNWISGAAGGWGLYHGNTIELNPGVPQNRRDGVLVHEIGHALGLGHTANYDSSSVMDHMMTGGDWPHDGDYKALADLWGQPGKGAKTYSDPGGGSDGFSVIGAAISKIQGLLDGWIDGARKSFTGNKFVEMPLGLGKKLIDDFFAYLGANDSSGDSETTGAKPVEAWRDTVKDALKRVGLPTSNDYVDAWLRQIQTESGGNPNAAQHGYVDVNTGGNEAAGLLQVTKSTWEAYRDPSLPNNRFDPLASAVAGMRWAKAAYGVQGMLGVIGHGHGYANGGHVKPLLFDHGGILEKGVQLIDHQRDTPDYVLTDKQWALAKKSIEGSTSGGTQVHVNVPEREGLDPTQMGNRIGETVAFQLEKAFV